MRFLQFSLALLSVLAVPSMSFAADSAVAVVVPEPATVALLAAGAIGLGIRRFLR